MKLNAFLRLKILKTYTRSPYGLLPIPCRAAHIYRVILGDPWPGAVSRVDKMFVVKVYCNLTVNFHHEPFIDPTKGLCNNYQEGGGGGGKKEGGG